MTLFIKDLADNLFNLNYVKFINFDTESISITFEEGNGLYFEKSDYGDIKFNDFRNKLKNLETEIR